MLSIIAHVHPKRAPNGMHSVVLKCKAANHQFKTGVTMRKKKKKKKPEHSVRKIIFDSLTENATHEILLYILFLPYVIGHLIRGNTTSRILS